MTTNLVPIQLTYKQLYDLYGNGSHNEFQAIEEDIFIKTPMNKYAPILGVICKHDQPIVRLDLSNSDAFECAEEHLFSCGGRSITAIDAVEIDLIDDGTATILEKTPLGIEHVYDIAIDAPHWYIADPDSGIIHHNTFFVMGIAKRWLDDHTEGCLIYYDTEAAVTKQMMADRGMDVSRIIIVESETIQKFRHNLLQTLDIYMKAPKDERPPLLIVLDSLGMMSTTKEMEDTTEGKETKDMTKSGIIKATFRVLGLKLAKAGVSLFVTNHVYAAIGAYMPTKVMGGGSGLPYAASQIVTLTKSKERDDEKNVTGNLITCTMTKSRFTKENLKVKVRLTYSNGLDRYFGLMDLAIDNGIVTKDGNRYVFPDGQKAFMKHIEESPETYFTADFLNILENVVTKTFKYGCPDLLIATPTTEPEIE